MTVGVLTVLITVPFVLAGVEPAILVGGGSGLGSAGVLLLMAIVSLAVVVWFQRAGIPAGENAWRTRIAPAASFLLLGAVVVYGLVRFDLLAGGEPGQYSWLLLFLLGAFGAGCLIALYMRSSRPEDYQQLGRRDRELSDDAVAG